MAPLGRWTLTSTNWQFHTNFRVCIRHTRCLPQLSRVLPRRWIKFWFGGQWLRRQGVWSYSSIWNMSTNNPVDKVSQDTHRPDSFILTYQYAKTCSCGFSSMRWCYLDEARRCSISTAWRGGGADEHFCCTKYGARKIGGTPRAFNFSLWSYKGKKNPGKKNLAGVSLLHPK